MARLTYRGGSFEAEDGESVLECLERAGCAPPSSCRSGQCQSCLMKATSGSLPPAAQQGLKDAWRAQGLFLACACRPTEDLEVADADGGALEVAATITGREVLSDEVVRIRLATGSPFEYRAGQFVSVIRPSDRLTRPYSLASLPSEPQLELHVRRVPGGRMSAWLCDEAPIGEPVQLRGPAGECFYLAGEEQPLVLAGTSTGLAPLVGIVRDALDRGHRGPIALYHGSVRASGLYLADELDTLATHPNVRVVRSVLEGPTPDGVVQEGLDALVLGSGHDLKAARAWLCGAPELVRLLKKKLFLAGMPLKAIASDPFVVAPAGA
ncbi:MAG: 2Fe-2S iron-sulfur cluster binding domain-containing protein [Alphaproteobacteria bacterium]|nr:2Fe-2S iron-sulfur cluster binding domain-containing protein [Alphaproteobacteria bacterium]MCB9688132.1 2Fe-2S iron-sulfur cluster binding domain-containing protein [Alphaproteobacteria bacterium]